MRFYIRGFLENTSCTKIEHVTTTIHFWSYLLRMRNVSDKSCKETQNAHVVSSSCFSKIVPLMREFGKYYRAGQAADDNMAHAHCVLDT